MSDDTLPVAGPHRPVARSGPATMLNVLGAIIRNPLKALPPEIFSEPIVFSRLAGKTRIHIADPALIHEALVKNADALEKGVEVRRALGPALGQGLLTSDGPHWRWQRQSVAGAFRHEMLLALQPAMIAVAERTRDRWLRDGARRIDIGHEMMRTTFDIIVDTMMSGGGAIDVERAERAITDYLKPSGWMFALAILGAPSWMPHPGRRGAARAVHYLRSSLAAMIAERRQQDDPRQDLVAMLLHARDPETGRTMIDDEIVDNLMTFITAGHETTALGLAWTFHLLARHPDVEAEALREIASVTGGGPLRAEHVADLVYTRQVFSEAMRLYPPAPIITRTALRDFRIGEHTVPEGAVLYVPIYAVHRHSKLWTDPEMFDPRRFAPDAVKARHRYAYMPFGGGPRVCIGNAFAVMEAVTVLAVLLPAFRLRNGSSTSPQPMMKVTLRPQQSIMMDLSPADASNTG
ncbi:cytochrome P450 [Terrihabitans rhizophilus]